MPADNTELLTPQQTQELQQEVSVIEARANELVIKTDEDAKGAADFLKQVKAVENTVTDRKEAITKPLNAALKSARALFAPFEDAAVRAGATIRNKLGAYQMEQERKARIEREKIEKQMEADRLKVEAGKMSEAKAEERMAKAEVKLETVTPPVAVKSENAAVSFREDRIVKSVDASKLPAEYLIPDTVKIGKVIRAGGTIPGVEVEIKKTPILR